MRRIKKIGVILLGMMIAISLVAMPAMAAEETEVNIVVSEEKTDKAESEAKPTVEETAINEDDAEKMEEEAVIERTAEKVQEVIEEAIEAVKESAETVKEKVEELKEKAEEATVHAEMELDAKLPEEAEEYTVSTPVFTEDGMLILPRPVKEGKHFIEWNTKEDGSGYGYKAGEIVDPTDIVLYSIWEDEVKEEELKAEEEELTAEEIVNDVADEEAEVKTEEIIEEQEEDATSEEAGEVVAEGEAKEETAEPEGAASEDVAEPEAEEAEE